MHELADSSIGDNYPVPGRILPHVEQIVRGYVTDGAEHLPGQQVRAPSVRSGGQPDPPGARGSPW
ncbi:hypothetical protein ABZ565_04145 [Streptomyces sp. NPDC016469]|uniref:hypothetical protein n=1 Tax=Streptomyces sp. NPDC016469 TaxID=3157191 RepID=UPI0033C1F071